MSSIKLRIEYPGGRVEERVLSNGRYQIGRETGDIVLGDPNVSTRHATLDVQDGRATLTDQGSTNGTFDGVVRLSGPYAMQENRPLRLGGTMLTIAADLAFGGTRVMPQAAGALAAPAGYDPSGASPYGQPPNANPYGTPPPNPYGGAPPAAPGAPNPYGAPQANPYGGAAPQAPNPYGAPQANPYGGAPGGNPYGAAPQANPYGGAPGASNPGAAPGSPYGAPPGSPYGAPPGGASPYGAPPGGASPYGAPGGASPYGAPGSPGSPGAASPYGASPGSPGGYGAPPGNPYGAPGSPPGVYGGTPSGFGGANPYSPQAAFGGLAGAAPLVLGGVPADVAQWPTRAIGFLIDQAIVGAVMTVFYIGVTVITMATASLASGAGDAANLLSNFFCCLGFGIYPVALLGVGGYNRAILVSKRGFSIGQGIMKLKVVDSRGEKLAMGPAWIRLLAQSGLALVGVGALVDLLFPLWDPNRQTLHDKAVGSYVLNNPSGK